jgi:dihydrofolate synthase / folylpolyglutamate synthase
MQNPMQKTLNYLYNLQRFGSKPGLENIRKLAQAVGNPQDNLQCIHVAGTNGKGSVCAMLDSILQQSNYKVGKYTSPHLVRFNERITVSGKEISNEDVLRLTQKIKKGVEENTIDTTFFEFTTVMAFLYFQENNVDFAVIETGMGGRLDATNIIKKENCKAVVITKIAQDHGEVLGNNLKKITWEKASIIKSGMPVFTTESNGNNKYRSVLEVIQKEASEKQAELIITSPSKHATNLPGSFQKENVGLAVSVARHLKIAEETLKEGLLNVHWPGRLQLVKQENQADLLLDAGHNPNALQQTIQYMKELKQQHGYEKVMIVFGVLKDKDYKKMYNLMSSSFPQENIMLTIPPHPKRALDPETVEEWKENKNTIIKDPVKAFKYVQENTTEEDLIVVTGSIFLVGKVMEVLEK